MEASSYYAGVCREGKKRAERMREWKKLYIVDKRIEQFSTVQGMIQR